MAELIWTTESTIELIKEYSKYPELWDPKNESFRVQSAKYAAWTAFAQAFNCDIADLRQKLNSILASHRREKAKVRNGRRSTWFLYQYMRFLPSHLENNEEPQKIEESEQSSDDDGSKASSEEEVTIKKEPATENYIVTEKRHHAKRPLTRKLKYVKILPKPKSVNLISKDKNISSTLDSRLLETLKLLKKSDLSKKKDECDSFGEYIAISLRKHDDRTQSMIKQAINNILFEQEMKKYNTGQYTVVISSADENPLILGDHDEQ